MRTGSIRRAHGTVALLALCLLAGMSCAPEPPLHLIVFLEATPDSAINGRLLQTYLRPLYERLAETQRAVNLEVYPISGNTEGETALMQLTLDEGAKTQDDAAVLAQQFSLLGERLNRVYADGGYLVDVLGAAILLDRFLGSTGEAPVEAIFISDMVQQEDTRGYDFTNETRGRTLEQCRADLESGLGSHLVNRQQFSRVRVSLVPINLPGIRRELNTRIVTTSVANMDEIQTFWTRDFFRDFLHVQEVKSYTGGTETLWSGLGL